MIGKRGNQWLYLVTVGAACATTPEVRPPDGTGQVGAVSRLDAELAALEPAPLLPAPDAQKRLGALIDDYYARSATRRAYIMVDKPLYQPGETIWFRAELRQTSSLMPA